MSLSADALADVYEMILEYRQRKAAANGSELPGPTPSATATSQTTEAARPGNRTTRRPAGQKVEVPQ